MKSAWLCKPNSELGTWGTYNIFNKVWNNKNPTHIQFRHGNVCEAASPTGELAGTWGIYSCKHSWNVGNMQLQTQLERGEYTVPNTVRTWGTGSCKHSCNVGNIQLQTQLERGEHAVAHTYKIRHHNVCKSVITIKSTLGCKPKSVVIMCVNLQVFGESPFSPRYKTALETMMNENNVVTI